MCQSDMFDDVEIRHKCFTHDCMCVAHGGEGVGGLMVVMRCESWRMGKTRVS